MENNIQVKKIVQMSLQDIAFGLAGSAGFVALLYILV